MLEKDDGLFDNFTPILKQFQDNIEWRKVDNDKYMPWPKPGLDDDIDELLKDITQLKVKLKEYIAKVRKQFDCSKISYAHNRKFVSFKIS